MWKACTLSSRQRSIGHVRGVLARTYRVHICAYVSLCTAPQISGGALVGIVLSVREAVRGVTGGALIRVRDLLDDSQVELSPGQVSHVSVKEAQRYLRADLLPPHEPGVPVTPLTAAPGLMVQRIGSWDARPGLTGSQTAADSETDAELASAPIFGRLVGPVEGASARWVVLWPDGTESEHNIGLDGDFALAHLHTHRLQGAPLLTSHITEDKVSSHDTTQTCRSNSPVSAICSPAWRAGLPFQPFQSVLQQQALQLYATYLKCVRLCALRRFSL